MYSVIEPSTATIRLSSRGWILFAILVLVLLLPTFASPLGTDQALFYVAGQKILRGSVHYREIIDIKPPAIYYLYAGAIALFGDHPYSIRIVDLVAQLSTVLLIVLFTRRTGDDASAAAAGLLYAFMYVAIGPRFGAVPEAYVGLLAIPCATAATNVTRRSGWFLAGALAGIGFLFKPTFAALLAVPIIAALVASSRTSATHRGLVWSGSLVAFTGFLAVGALLPIYLWAADAYTDYLRMQEFASRYVQLTVSASPGIPVVSDLINGAMRYLMPGTLLGIAIGASLGFRRTPSGLSSSAHHVLRISAVGFLILLGTVIVENRAMPFHLVRLLSFGSVLFAIGGIWAWRRIRQIDRRILRGLLSVGLLVALVGAGPLPRFAIWTYRSLLWPIGGAAAYDRTIDPAREAYSFSELDAIGILVRSRLLPGERLFAFGGDAGHMYMAAGYVPPYAVLHAAYVKSPFGAEAWRAELKVQLLSQPPRFIAAQIADRFFGTDGSHLSSLEYLQRFGEVGDMLRDEYRVVWKGTWFVLFEKAERVGQTSDY